MYGNYYKKGDVIDYTASANIAGGTLVTVAGGVGLISSDLANGATAGAIVEGIVEYDCLSTDTPSAGTTLYLDTTNNRLTTTASSWTAAGKAVEAKASGVSKVKCLLNRFSNAAALAI